LVEYFPNVKDVDPNWIGAVIQTLLSEYVDDDEPGESPAPTNGAAQ
jgi:hypothetical protein